MAAIRPRVTFRVRTLIALVALSAVLLAVWKKTHLDPVESWLNAIHDDDDGPRRWEAITRARSGQAKGVNAAEAVDFLIDALRDPSMRVRRSAAASLPEFGPASLKAVPALIRATIDPDDLVRASAASALGEIRTMRNDPDRDDLVSALTRMLADRSSDNRLRAAHALAQQGEGEAALPTLLDALGSHDHWKRYLAMSGLHFLSGDEAKAAIPALKRIAEVSLRDEHGGDASIKPGCVHAAELLYQFGERDFALVLLEEAETRTDIWVPLEARRVRDHLEHSRSITWESARFYLHNY